VTPPRVLVLLATYNGAAFLDQQLASILWQVGAEPHVLARDDGSSDGTAAMLDAWAGRWPDRLTVLRDGERAGSASGNFFRLLAAAPLDSFDHVAFADQDDIWFPDKLARAAAAMAAAGAGGYSSDLLAFDERSGASWTLSKAGLDAELDYLFQGASAGCTYVLSVQAARAVRDVMAPLDGTWPRGMSHDWTIYAACRSRGMGWVRDTRSSLLYRQHGANDYGARRGLRGLWQRLGAVRDAWYRDHVSWLRHVVVMTPAERQVFDALDRGDRRWLVRSAHRFRRTGRAARLLALSFATGLF